MEDPDDRRTVRLVLTDRSRQILAEGRAAQIAFVARIHEGISAEELSIMSRITQKISQNIIDLDV